MQGSERTDLHRRSKAQTLFSNSSGAQLAYSNIDNFDSRKQYLEGDRSDVARNVF